MNLVTKTIDTSIYDPQKIVTAGEVDLTKHPSKWKGWDSLNFAFGGPMTWEQRKSDYYGPLDRYKGRLLFWMGQEKRLWVTVLRWDDPSSKHIYKGRFTNGYSARMALGSLTYCGSKLVK